MREINFIAIDFETATGKSASICEAGIRAQRNAQFCKKHVELLYLERGG